MLPIFKKPLKENLINFEIHAFSIECLISNTNDLWMN